MPVTNAELAPVGGNTVKGNPTGSTAVPQDMAMPSCSGASNALTWTSGTGIGCNTIAGAGGSTGAIQYNSGSSFAGASITGLVKGNGSSAPTAYAGAGCTSNEFVEQVAANGTLTCAPVSVIIGATINNTTVGLTTPAAGAFLTGGINPLIAPYSAPSNGTSDASAALSSACSAASAAGEPLLVDLKYAVLSNVTLACDLQFDRGGTLTVSSGYIVTHQGYISAPRDAYIFTGAGTVTTTSSYRSVAWWGALSLQAVNMDPAPAIQAAAANGSYSTIDMASGQYTFQSASQVPNYPAINNYAVLFRGLTGATVDRRGASFTMSNGFTFSEIFGWENDTDLTILGGDLIGNRAGLTSSQENGGDVLLSTTDLKLLHPRYTGDWNTLGAPIAATFNTGCTIEIDEEDNAGIGADFGSTDACDITINRTTGENGQEAFSNIWDQHFAVTTALTANASQGATSISVGHATISAVSNNSGAVELTVSSTNGLISGNLAVSGFTGSYAPLNYDFWYFSVIDTTHLILLGSTYSSGTVAGSPVVDPLISSGDELAIGTVQLGYQYVTATGGASGGSVAVSALPSAATSGQYVTDLHYNQTGVNFVEGAGNHLKILHDFGGYNVGIQLETGGWTVDGDISNNTGTSLVSGVGIYATYNNSGSFITEGHPLGATIFRGRYANNGNATNGGYGIELNTNQLVNGDLFGPITIDNPQLDNNNNYGIFSSASSGFYGLAINGVTGSGTSQTTLVDANTQEAADPPPTGFTVSGAGSGATVGIYGTGVGHHFVISITAGSGASASGSVSWTMPSSGNSGGMTFGWECQAMLKNGSAGWAQGATTLSSSSSGTALATAWNNNGSGLSNGNSYQIIETCWHT